MSAYTQLLDVLRMRLPGAVDGLIQLELFNNVNELCRTAEVYQSTLEITLIEAQTVYTIPQDDQRIARFYDVSHATLDTSDSLFDPDTSLLSLAHQPTSADITAPLYADVALAPVFGTDPEDLLTDRLYEETYDGLLDGVLGRMMTQVAKPYSNERMAAYHLKRFRNFMAQAHARVVNESVESGQNWSFPTF